MDVNHMQLKQTIRVMTGGNVNDESHMLCNNHTIHISFCVRDMTPEAPVHGKKPRGTPPLSPPLRT